MSPAANNIPTGPSTVPVTDMTRLRDRLEDAENRLARLERNRPNRPLSQPTRNGHVPAYNVGTLPVLGELVFHMPGSLTIATSPPDHARWSANIIGLAVDLDVYVSGTLRYVVTVNGSTIPNQPSGGWSQSAATAQFSILPFPINAYTDLVRVSLTAIGSSSNHDAIFHVELG